MLMYGTGLILWIFLEQCNCSSAYGYTKSCFVLACCYPLARMSFRGKKFVFLQFLQRLLIPFQAIMLPVYIITLKLHLIDSVNNVMGYIGLVMPFAVSAFGIFLMRQAFIKVPKEVEEAAIVDGCNVFQMFTRVVIPMVKPTLAVLAVFTFIGSWGEFLWPSIMLTKDAMYTLPVGINNLQGMFSSNWRFIAAGSIISTIPIIVFFDDAKVFYIRRKRWRSQRLTFSTEKVSKKTYHQWSDDNSVIPNLFYN